MQQLLRLRDNDNKLEANSSKCSLDQSKENSVNFFPDENVYCHCWKRSLFSQNASCYSEAGRKKANIKYVA